MLTAVGVVRSSLIGIPPFERLGCAALFLDVPLPPTHFSDTLCIIFAGEPHSDWIEFFALYSSLRDLELTIVVAVGQPEDLKGAIICTFPYFWPVIRPEADSLHSPVDMNSDSSKFMTGQQITVDGGYTLT